MPFPEFVTGAEREALAQELAALDAVGEARAFLTTASLAWARERPADPEGAEALARSIEGWRWSPCTDGMTSDLPRRAFAVLHRQFPRSEWARRTRYWYW